MEAKGGSTRCEGNSQQLLFQQSSFFPKVSMPLAVAREVLKTAHRNTLHDRSFGDSEVLWTVDGSVVAHGYFKRDIPTYPVPHRLKERPNIFLPTDREPYGAFSLSMEETENYLPTNFQLLEAIELRKCCKSFETHSNNEEY